MFPSNVSSKEGKRYPGRVRRGVRGEVPECLSREVAGCGGNPGDFKKATKPARGRKKRRGEDRFFSANFRRVKKH